MDQYLICNENFTIREVLQQIDKNSKGTAFVLDNDEKLVGVVTDGDIRRMLINGAGLDDTLVGRLNKNYVYANEGTSRRQIISLLNRDDGTNISIIPIIDKENKVVDYFEFNTGYHIPIAEPTLNGNEYKYLNDALLSTWISSNGKYIIQFEETFSNWCGCECGVATSNGTTALHLALEALRIRAGDEVIVPNLTFAATVNAVLYCNATPVLVDVESDGWCIDPDEIERAITSKTKAIIPVHLYGQPCNMERIMKIAHKHNLYVVEDCAEAHGAMFKGQKVGSFGDIGCYSFFGNKVITTGEGGMCITNNKELQDKMRVLRDHGMSKTKRYYHDVVGFNYRMTNMQAAIGCAQVERIDEILGWRQKLEDSYYDKLSGINGVEFQRRDIESRRKIAWLVSILVPADKRSVCIDKMKENGIDARNFFTTLSDMGIYKDFKFSDSVSRDLSARGINLPTNLSVTDDVIERIASVLRDAIE